MQTPRIDRKKQTLEVTVPEDRLPAMRDFLIKTEASSVQTLGLAIREYPTLVEQAESSGSSLKGLLTAAKAYAESIKVVGDPSREYDEKLNESVEDVPVALKGDKTGLGFLAAPPRKKPETKTENPQAMKHPQKQKAFEHKKPKPPTPAPKQTPKPVERPQYADKVEGILEQVETRGGHKSVVAEALLAQLSKKRGWQVDEMRGYLLSIMKPKDAEEYKKRTGMKEKK